MERARIQRHLSRVEAQLRAVDVSHLSPAQRASREAALDRLHEYWRGGAFPHNDYLNGRTPVFIDRSGRACAMGDLLIHTGHTDEAEVIAATENLARVVEIESVDLGPWLEAHGITLAEAQAIQPSYCMTCDPDLDLPVCGVDGIIYQNECVARCEEGVSVAFTCSETPCVCGTDGSVAEPDAGPPVGTPVSDDGCSAAGGGGALALPFLLLLLARRRRAQGASKHHS
jgi:uncharacterized protein (TIGR03382 family)